MSSAARLQIQFLGLNEGDDPKNLPPGTLLRAHNCAMDKARRIVKRYGTIELTHNDLTGDEILTGNRILPMGAGGLGIVAKGAADTTAYSYASPLAIPKWSAVDLPPVWRGTKRTLVDSTRSVQAVDIAISGDMLAILYMTAGGGIYVRIDSLSTGAALLPPQELDPSGSANPRILISGTTALVLFAGTSVISYQAIDLTTMALGASGDIVSNATSSPTVFDAVIGTPAAGVATLYIFYELASGTNRARLASFTFSTLAPVATLDSLGTGLRCACVAFGSAAQKVTAVYSSSGSTTTKVTSCTTALASQIGPTELYAGVSDNVIAGEDTATNVLLGWSRGDGNGTDADRLTTALYSVAAHAQVAVSERITFGLYNPTKPWKTSGRWFVGAVTWVHPYSVTLVDPIAQPSTIVVAIDTSNTLASVQDATHPHVATLENQTGWYGTGLGQTKPAIDGSGNVWLASPYRNREPDNYVSQIPIGWSLFRLAPAEADTFRSALLGAGALLAGAAPAWSDGSSVMPYGFAHAPQIISVTAANSGNVTAGTYSYVATYAWRDASGVLHRSSPSPPKTGVTATTNLTMVVKVATASLSGKQRTQTITASAGPVMVELWRTAIGGTGPHYRLTLEPTYQVLFNNPRVGDVSLSDTKPDANIASGAPAVTLDSQQQLYTDLGELENVPPPSFVTVATHRGRLVGLGPDLRTVWLSKDSTIDTTIAPGFNEALTLAFAHDKTALASLDMVLVVFGEDTIDVVQGDGPDDKGDANTWQIQAVQTDVGCINPRSVVTDTPMGCLFLSRRGLELLDRGLNVTWFGEGIVDTLIAYPTITSGVLVASETEVRWTCDNGATGIVLAYNYLHKVWFTRSYLQSDEEPAIFADAALIDGVYTLLTTTGRVLRETPSNYLDSGLYVERDVLLAPISAQAGRAGWSNDNLAWQRAKDLTLMGTSTAQHDLKVSFARDYANTFEQTHTFVAGSEVTTPGPLEKGRITVERQKCQAIQIRIQDLTPTGYAIANSSAGPILESLCLRVGAQQGPAKTTAGQQA